MTTLAPATDPNLPLNAGSSSFKFALFERTASSGQRAQLRGRVTGLGSAPRLVAHDAEGALTTDERWPDHRNPAFAEVLEHVLSLADRHADRDGLPAVGHRAVHGGADHVAPARLTLALRAELRVLIRLGNTADELKAEGSPGFQIPFRVIEGNQSTNVILADWLDPTTLGRLIALYEHGMFTQDAVWAIDSFDQWGVEHDKVLASRTVPELDRGAEPKLSHDTSTNALIQRYRRHRG